MGLERFPRHSVVSRNVITVRSTEVAIGERERESQRTVETGVCGRCAEEPRAVIMMPSLPGRAGGYCIDHLED